MDNAHVHRRRTDDEGTPRRCAVWECFEGILPWTTDIQLVHLERLRLPADQLKLAPYAGFRVSLDLPLEPSTIDSYSRALRLLLLFLLEVGADWLPTPRGDCVDPAWQRLVLPPTHHYMIPALMLIRDKHSPTSARHALAALDAVSLFMGWDRSTYASMLDRSHLKRANIRADAARTKRPTRQATSEQFTRAFSESWEAALAAFEELETMLTLDGGYNPGSHRELVRRRFMTVRSHAIACLWYMAMARNADMRFAYVAADAWEQLRHPMDPGRPSTLDSIRVLFGKDRATKTKTGLTEVTVERAHLIEGCAMHALSLYVRAVHLVETITGLPSPPTATMLLPSRGSGPVPLPVIHLFGRAWITADGWRAEFAQKSRAMAATMQTWLDEYGVSGAPDEGQPDPMPTAARMTPHGVRASAATHAIMAGAAPTRVAAHGRWAGVGTVMRHYARLDRVNVLNMVQATRQGPRRQHDRR